METINFKTFEKDIDAAFSTLAKEKIIDRIWKKDWTIWKSDPTEIANRLGWLFSPFKIANFLLRAEQLARDVKQDGYTHAVVLGMGGSSLAPLVLSSAFRTKAGFLDLSVLDSTVPGSVLEFSRKLNPRQTLFVVSSKSGTTAETQALFHYFWGWTARSVGTKKVGGHFIAVTDPGTPLAQAAQRLGFRSLFLGDPDIGGRFSALSPFGLVPASLKGLDLRSILRSAEAVAENCREKENLRANPGAYLGSILQTMARAGRDKLTLILSPRIQSFGLWLEQLIAESTGKEGKGIVPIEGEPLGPPRVYGPDRFFVSLVLGQDSSAQALLRRWEKTGFPILSISIPTASELGGQFFLWEFAIAIAGYFLGLNPFNQPDVDSTKKKTQAFLKAYQEKKQLPEQKPSLQEGGISLFLEGKASTLAEGLTSFLAQARAGDYIAIQAFLPPRASIDRALQDLRTILRDKTGLAVTVGFGPRYLHSTGQLHKGDAGRGLFIQLTSEPSEDLPVPDAPGCPNASLTFGVLSAAQAWGDGAALQAAGRRLLRFHLRGPVMNALRKILSLTQHSFSSSPVAQKGYKRS